MNILTELTKNLSKELSDKEAMDCKIIKLKRNINW